LTFYLYCDIMRYKINYEVIKIITNKVTNQDHLMTKEEWIADCESGGLIDYDGYAEYSDGIIKYRDYIRPSQRKHFNDKYTHVVWYNK